MEMAKLFRIFEPDPDQNFIQAREKAINRCRRRLLRKRNPSELVIIGNSICEGFFGKFSIHNDLVNQVEDEIMKEIGSFVGSERNLELTVCATATVIQSITSKTMVMKWNGWSVSDTLAASLWSGLSFLPTCNARKLETLRNHSVNLARERILKTSSETRVRYVVSPMEQTNDEEPRTVEKLLKNATFDREEINLLQWALNGKSRIFEKPIKLLPPETRALTAGLEIGSFMRAPPSQWHRDLCSDGLEEKEPVPLCKFLDALGKNIDKIANPLKGNSLISEARFVFPLLFAISTGKDSGPGANLPRCLSEWGTRALLEHALLQTKQIYEDSKYERA